MDRKHESVLFIGGLFDGECYAVEDLTPERIVPYKENENDLPYFQEFQGDGGPPLGYGTLRYILRDAAIPNGTIRKVYVLEDLSEDEAAQMLSRHIDGISEKALRPDDEYLSSRQLLKMFVADVEHSQSIRTGVSTLDNSPMHLNPRYAIEAARFIRDKLAEFDPLEHKFDCGCEECQEYDLRFRRPCNWKGKT